MRMVCHSKRELYIINLTYLQHYKDLSRKMKDQIKDAKAKVMAAVSWGEWSREVGKQAGGAVGER